MADGKIFAIETMGLTDGPGIRMVVFLQGCALRCGFCHNPESWSGEGRAISSAELLQKALRYVPYFERTGGGVTFSGGEPLLQPAFLSSALAELKRSGIHTCIDTAGVGLGDYGEILENCDLVLFDVKDCRPENYLALTGRPIDESERFLKALEKSRAAVTVRQVVVPKMTDSEEYMDALADYIKEKIPTATSCELLPYRTLGVHKYSELGINYALEGVPPMDSRECDRLQSYVNGRLKFNG